MWKENTQNDNVRQYIGLARKFVRILHLREKPEQNFGEPNIYENKYNENSVDGFFKNYI